MASRCSGIDASEVYMKWRDIDADIYQGIKALVEILKANKER